MRYVLIIITLFLLSCVSNPPVKDTKDISQELAYIAGTFSMIDETGNLLNSYDKTCLIRLKNVKTSQFQTLLFNEKNSIEVFSLDEGDYIITAIGLYPSIINIYFPNKFRRRKHMEDIPIELIRKIEVRKNKITYLGKLVVNTSEWHMSYIDDFDTIVDKNNTDLDLIQF